MDRRRWTLGVVVVAVLGGCGPGPAGESPRAESQDALHVQAQAALARYDEALRKTDSRQRFLPVGDLTGQLGDWEPANGDHKRALAAGRIVAGATLPAAPRPTGAVVWPDGTSRELPLIAADEALSLVASAGTGDCGDCVPLTATGARLSSVPIQTTRGPATAPAWVYTLRGTAVRVTRVAVADSATVKVTPPSWDPYHAPGGLAINSATTTTSGKRLTVAFTGTPEPGRKPCGADYSATAVESADAVVVILREHRHAANEMCTSIGGRRTATVELGRALGERAVLEVQQGLPVPVTVSD